jgi:hypothetical protein
MGHGGMALIGLSQAKPSEAKVLTAGGDLREAQVCVPPLFAIPAFDRIPGHSNRPSNSNGEYANCNFSKFRLKALTNGSQTVSKTNYGSDKHRLVGCLDSELRLARSQARRCATVSSVRRMPSRLGEGWRAVPRLCILYPGSCLTTERKSRKNLSQCIRKALG